MNIPKDFAHRADAHLQAWTDVEQFSGSALVAWNDEVLFNRGYGLANREHAIPNAPDTKFRLGSITKQFAAVAILILQEQGKLNVADLLSCYLDDSPDAWEKITLHHLLNHSSGIPNYTGFIEWDTEGRSPLGVWGVVDLFRDKLLAFAPGSQHSYSNSGYHLLGCVVEKASGKSFADFLQEAVFDPLAMADSGYDSSSALIARRASGYSLVDGDWRNAAYLDMSNPYAAGGLYSTTEDLLKWSRGLDAASILSVESLRTMSTLSPLLTTYGYGVTMKQLHGRRWVTHGGGIHGFRTHLMRCPDERGCVVVLTNLEQANPTQAALDLVALMVGEDAKKPAPLDEAALREYAGEYEMAPGIRVSIEASPPGITARATGGHEIVLLLEGDDRFFSSTSDCRIRFGREDGAVTHLVLKQGGLEEQADKA